jgi:hypothetical protein
MGITGIKFSPLQILLDALYVLLAKSIHLCYNNEKERGLL